MCWGRAPRGTGQEHLLIHRTVHTHIVYTLTPHLSQVGTSDCGNIRGETFTVTQNARRFVVVYLFKLHHG